MGRGVEAMNGNLGAGDDRRSSASSPARRLLLSPTPDACVPDDLEPFEVLTPNGGAARTLAPGASARSLEAAANVVLRAHGVERADVYRCQSMLRRAVSEELRPRDPVGTATTMSARVKELLRSGIGFAALDETGLGPRAVGLLAVTRRYRRLLRGDEPASGPAYVDPAEAPWVAARVADPSQRRRVCVLGYPQLGVGEYALIDALAAPGSLVVLPLGNEDAAEVLAAAGWTVERRHDAPRTVGERLAAAFAASRSEPSTDDGPATLATPRPQADPGAVAGSVGPCSVPLEPVQAWRFPSQEAEVRHVLATVRTLLHAGAEPAEIVLATRDEAAYGPLLRAIGWEYGLPVSLSYGVPLEATRPGSWFASFAEVLTDDAPFDATARFLAHPLGPGLPATTWREARRQRPSGLPAWSAFEPRLADIDWRSGRAPRAHWRDRVLAAIDLFGLGANDATGATDGSREAPGSTADTLARLHLERAIRWVARDGRESVTGAAFLTDVLSVMANVTARAEVPPPSPRQRVELHTPLALYGTRHRFVFLLGAVEGVLPEPVRDDPALDLHDRRALRAAGLPLDDVLDMVRREQRSFEALLRGVGEHLVITVPDEVDGQLHLPSPYLDALGLEPTAPPTKHLASPQEARRQALRGQAASERLRDDAVTAAAIRALAVEARRESAAEPDVYDGVAGVPVDPDSWRFSASQLVALGQCAFRWFAQQRLRIADPEEREDEVDARLRGQLWHRTLEIALRGALRHAPAEELRDAPPEELRDAPPEERRGVPPEERRHAPPDAMRGAVPGAVPDARAGDVEGSVDGASGGATPTERLRARALARLEPAFEAAESELGLPESGAWLAIRQEHLAALRRVVAGRSFLPEGAEVLRLEARFRTDWRGLQVSGLIDRIDRGQDGLVLWDYKTSGSRPAGAKDAEGRARLDVQLPLYRQAGAPALLPGASVADAMYFSLTKNARLPRPKVDDEALDALAAYAKASLADGRYPVEPDVDARACETCAFDLVCRMGPRVDRKRAAREAAETTAASAT